MLLVIDIGNTNTVIGVYKNKELIKFWRLATDKNKTSDEIGMVLMQLLNYESIEVTNITNVIISSVVPSIMNSVENAMKKYITKNIIIVGPGVKTGINIKYDNPKEVGADRIVNAIAGYEIYGGPLIIVDFGTATTFCAINKWGEYLGGAICPGVSISIEALFEKASKLPRIDLVRPDKIIGKNTIESMQAGVLYGYVGQVDYIVNKMKEEVKEEYGMKDKEKIRVIATGGLATMLSEHSSTIDEVNHFLTIEGLRLIYNRNN